MTNQLGRNKNQDFVNWTSLGRNLLLSGGGWTNPVETYDMQIPQELNKKHVFETTR